MKSVTSSPLSGRSNLAVLTRIAAFVAIAALLALPLFSSSLASAAREKLAVGTASTPAAAGDFNRMPRTSDLLFKSNSAPFPLMMPQGPAETIETFASDCTTPKTDFDLGETVCAKITGAPLGDADRAARRIGWVSPYGSLAQGADITTDPQNGTYLIPTDQTQTFTDSGGGTVVVDNRGTWTVNTFSTADGSLQTSANFTVHDPATPYVDLSVGQSVSETGSTVSAGSTGKFSIIVSNRGPDAGTNVVLAGAVPNNSTFNAMTQTSGPTFSCTTPTSGGTGAITCSLASLARGDSASFDLAFTVDPGTPNGTLITSNATISSATAELVPDDNASTRSAMVGAGGGGAGSCTLSCPGNITVTASLGQNGATVTFASPTTSGTCSSVSVVPASGSFFAIGTSVVTASTEEGESCSFTVTVNAAEDNVAPVISCPANITVDESSSAADSANITYNVTATDNSGSATVSCNPPSGSSFPIGTHQVTCTAEDAAGNTDTCTFNVTVNQLGCDLDANSLPPTPNVASLPTITAACSVTLQNDRTATDACGATINGQITAVNGQASSESTFDTPGTYVVTWSYTDSAGHTTTQDQTVTIQADSSAPVLNVTTLPTVTGECSVTLTPPTATDNCAGTVEGTTASLLVQGAGTHTVVWTYDDGNGNTSQQNQTVVVTDTAAPSVSLNGPSSVTVECHTSYTDAGASATDNCSPAPTPTSTSNVDVNTPGTYQVVWSATDAGGNTDSETRTVVVVDTIKPVITLSGASTMTVECHTAFTDPGASATDSCDTTVPVNVAGSVSADAVGTYTLTYTASDDSSNAATSVSRTVNVVDTTAPAVTLNGAATMTVILGSSFTDPGATANDSCTGSLAVTVSGSVNTNAVGAYTLTYSATDASNNTGTATRTVNVIYDFAGFFSPVANAPVLNAVNAGRAIPVKFSLAGDQGLNIFAANNPYSVSLNNCSTSDPGVDVTETLTAGGSSLSYSGGQYIYVWKTESSWANTCRQLVITLNDGTVHTANFKFK